MATTQVKTINPASRKKKNMAAAKKKNPANPPPRRRRRRPRKNPGMHPALLSFLSTLAGTAVGAGGDVALRYTSLSPYARGGILAATGAAGGVALSFLDPALGAGVGGGLGAVGGAEMLMEATAPKAKETEPADAIEMELGRVRAELGRVKAQLGAGRRAYPALAEGNSPNDLVEVDEEDLAHLRT